MVPEFAVAGSIEEQESRSLAGGGVVFGAVAVWRGAGGGWESAERCLGRLACVGCG